MLTRLKNRKSFKAENLRSWEDNSEFWLKYSFVDINVQYFLMQTIQRLCTESKNNKYIADLGCGNGWLLQCLMKRNISFLNYNGIDFNHKFIEYLEKKYSEKNIKFICIDIEKDFPPCFINKFDIVVNCLNLIETPNLNKVFHNIANITKKGGSILIVSLNPIVEIIRDGSGLDDIKKNLSIFEIAKNKTIIFKKIKYNEHESNKYYYRILYSFEDYYNISKMYNFELKNTFSVNGNRDMDINPNFEFFQFIKTD